MSVNIQFSADVLPVQRGIQTIDRQMSGLIQSADRVSRATSRVNFDGVTRVNTRNAVTQMDHLTASVQRLERQSTMTGRLIRSTFMSIAGAVTGGMLVNTLAGFERSMSRVAAITGASRQELAALRDTASSLGATTEFTASQAADALTFLGMAGFNAAESMAAIPQVLDLATASGMDLARTADITSNIMSAFGFAADQAAEVTDVLAVASTRANTNVEQLGTAMAYVGPVANALGISVNDSAAAIGVLSDAGIQGSMAGTSLRRVISSLANSTPKARAALAGMGLTVDQLNPATRTLTDIVHTLAEAGLDAEAAFTIFGDRGAPAIMALVENTGKLEELTDVLKDVEGATFNMASTMRDNLRGDIDSLVSATQGLIIAFGDAGLTTALRFTVQQITNLVRAIASAVNFIGDLIKGVIFTVKVLGYMGYYLLENVGIISRFSGMLDSLRGIIASMNFTDLFSAVPSTLIEQLKTAGSVLLGFSTSIAAIAVTATTTLRNMLGRLNIAEYFAKIKEDSITVVSSFVNEVIKLFNYLGTVLVWNSIVPDMVREILRWFAELPSKAVEYVKTMVASIVAAFKQTFPAVVTLFSAFNRSLGLLIDSIIIRFKAAFKLGFEGNDLVRTLAAATFAVYTWRRGVVALGLSFSLVTSLIGLFTRRITVLRFLLVSFRNVLIALTVLPTLSGFLAGLVSERSIALFSRLKEAVSAMVADITTAFTTRLSSILGRVSAFVEGVSSWFMELGRRLIWGSIVPDMLNDIRKAFIDFTVSTYNLLLGFGRRVINFFTGIWRSLRSMSSESVFEGLGEFRDRVFTSAITVSASFLSSVQKAGQDVSQAFTNSFNIGRDWLLRLTSFDANVVLTVGTAIGALLVSSTLRGIAAAIAVRAGIVFALLPALGSDTLRSTVYAYTSGLVGLIAEAMGVAFTSPGLGRMNEEVWSKILTPPAPDETAVKRYFRLLGNLIKTIGSTVAVSVADNFFGYTEEQAERFGQIFGSTFGITMAVAIGAAFSSNIRKILGIGFLIKLFLARFNLIGLAIGAAIGAGLGAALNIDPVSELIGTISAAIAGLLVAMSVSFLGLGKVLDRAIRNNVFKPLRKTIIVLSKEIISFMLGTLNPRSILIRLLAAVGIAAIIRNFFMTAKDGLEDGSRTLFLSLAGIVTLMKVDFSKLFAIFSSGSGGSGLFSKILDPLKVIVARYIALFSGIGPAAYAALKAGFGVFSVVTMTSWLMNDIFDFGETFWDRMTAGLLAGVLVGGVMGRLSLGIAVGLALAIKGAWNTEEMKAAIDFLGEGLFGPVGSLYEAINRFLSGASKEGGWFSKLVFHSTETAFMTAWAAIKWNKVLVPLLFVGLADAIAEGLNEALGLDDDVTNAIERAIQTGGVAALGIAVVNLGRATPLGRLYSVGATIGGAIVGGIVGYFESGEVAEAIRTSLIEAIESSFGLEGDIDSAFASALDGLLVGLVATGTVSVGRAAVGMTPIGRLANVGIVIASTIVGGMVGFFKSETARSQLWDAITNLLQNLNPFDLSDRILSPETIFGNQSQQLIRNVEIALQDPNADLEEIQAIINSRAVTLRARFPDLTTEIDQLQNDLVQRLSTISLPSTSSFENMGQEAGQAFGSGFWREVGALFRMLSPTVSFNATGADPIRKANGGYISGPGGPRSDSIPAMLSNGEFVINAASTKKFLPLLQSINSNSVSGFNNGGMAGYEPVGPRRVFTNPDGSIFIRVETIELSSKAAGSFVNTARSVFGEENVLLEKGLRFFAGAFESASNSVTNLTTRTRETTEATVSLNTAAEKTPRALSDAEKAFQDLLKSIEEAFTTKNPLEMGLSAATSFRDDFKRGFMDVLTGENTFGGFAELLLNNFTMSVIDSFAQGFTDAIFNNEGLGFGKVFTNFFGGLSQSFNAASTEAMTGEGGFLSSFGSVFKSLFSNIGSIFKTVFSFIGFANGGYVSGPGGPRSDAIPAMLSNGEYVINSESTRRFRPLLEAINAGSIPKGFAAGGMVESNAVTALSSLRSTGSGDTTEVNLSITGDISRQTRQEVRKMIPEIASQLSSYQRDRNR